MNRILFNPVNYNTLITFIKCTGIGRVIDCHCIPVDSTFLVSEASIARTWEIAVRRPCVGGTEGGGGWL